MRKRFRLQFTLRSLLVTCAVLCVPLAWFAQAWRSAENQRLIIKELNEQGFGCSYETDEEVAAAKWLPINAIAAISRCLGPDFLHKVIEASNLGSSKTDHPSDLFTNIGRLRAVEYISVHAYGPVVTGNQLRQLSGLEKLRSLTLADCKLETHSLNALGDCKALEELDLSNCRNFDDEDCRWIADSCPKLQLLGVDGTSITNAGVAALSALAELQELDVGETAASTFEGFPSLKRVDFFGDELHSAPRDMLVFAHLPRLEIIGWIGTHNLRLIDLPSLQRLDCNCDKLQIEGLPALHDCSLTAFHDEGGALLRDLAHAPSIRRINLWGFELTGDVLGSLASLPDLHMLVVWGSDLNADDLAGLRAAPSLSSLYVSAQSLKKSDGAVFRELPQLQHLFVVAVDWGEDAATAVSKVRNIVPELQVQDLHYRDPAAHPL